MEGNGDAPSVGMVVALMTALLGTKIKPVVNERTDDLTSGQTAQPAILNRHRLNSDQDARFREHLDLFFGAFWNGNAVFDKLIHNHLDDFLNVLQGFLFSASPSDGSVCFERRAEDVKGRATIIKGIRLNDHLKAIGFGLYIIV